MKDEPKRELFISWNEDKTEGVITIKRDQAKAAIDGDFSDATVLGDAFNTQYGKGMCTIETVEVAKNGDDAMHTITSKSSMPKSSEKHVQRIFKQLVKIVDKKESKVINGQISAAAVTYFIAAFANMFRNSGKHEDDLIDFMANNAKKVVAEQRAKDKDVRIMAKKTFH